MLCPQCGKPVEDGAVTCPYCGAALQQNPRQEQSSPLYTRPPEAAPPPAYSTAEPPVIQLMRRMARSPYFLVPAIGYTCMLVFNVMATLQSTSTAALESYLAPLYAYSTDVQMADLADTLSTVLTASAGGALVGQIPAILVAVGIWMMYATAVDTSGKPLQTAGLTIIRVIQIIVLVLVGIMMVLMLGLMGIALTTVGFGDNSEVFTPLVAMMLFILVVVVVLVMLYGVQFIRTLDSIRKTIWTGTLQGNISAYVAVCSILGGIVMVLNILLGLLARAPFTALSGVSGAVSGICFGILLFRCRDEWQRLKAEQTLTESTVR